MLLHAVDASVTDRIGVFYRSALMLRAADQVEVMNEDEIQDAWMIDGRDGDVHAVASPVHVVSSRELTDDDERRLLLSAGFRVGAKMLLWTQIVDIAIREYEGFLNHGDARSSMVNFIGVLSLATALLHALGGVNGIGDTFDSIENRLDLLRRMDRVCFSLFSRLF